MLKLKWVFRVLLYLSVCLVLYYLYTFDYLILNNLQFNIPLLVLSIIILWAGFTVSALSWGNSLKVHNIKISKKLALYSHGVSVFAKYIPGKIWVILGRASVVVNAGFGSLSHNSAISLKEQLVYLFTGLFVSLIALLFISIKPVFIVIVALTALCLYLFLFWKKVYNLAVKIYVKLFKKSFNVPFVGLKAALPIFKAVFGYWFLWSFGFYLLTLSLIPGVPVIVAFAFPVSVCYGLLAVIVPGGIGVRESIIVLILTAAGIDPAMAVTISVIQRLWFVSGEIFIFTLAWFVKITQKKWLHVN